MTDIGVGVRGRLFREFFETHNQLRPGRNHERLFERAQHLVHRLAVTVNPGLEDRHPTTRHRKGRGAVLGQQDGVTDETVADQRTHLAFVAPGAFVQLVRGQQDASALKYPGLLQRAECFNGRRHTTFHVGYARAVEIAVLFARRHKRQMNRVQMTVKLQRASPTTAVQASDDGRRLRPVGFRTFHCKAAGLEDLRQPIGRRPGVACGARHLDERHRSFDEAVGVDGGNNPVGEFSGNHDVTSRLHRASR